MNSSGSGDHTQSNPETLPGPGRAAADGDGTQASTGDWAICCSGGGIRSAAYCLGALQSLDQGGLVAKARWILGVSGGSYIATSRALVAHYLHLPGAKNGVKERPAYAPGTAEERNLRCDTRYLASNGSTILVGVLSLFLGAICTFAIALAPLYAITHAWGWLLRWQAVVIPSGPHRMTATVTNLGWWLPSVIAAGIVLIVFLCWWWTLEPGGRRARGLLMRWKPDNYDGGADRAWLVSLVAALAAGLALAMFAAPLLISWLTRSTGSLGTVAQFAGFGARPSWSWSAVAGLIAAVTAIAKSGQAGLAKWTATTAAASSSSAAQPSLVTRVAGRIRQLLLPWVASAAIVLAGAVFALLWTSDGARAGFSAGQLLPVAVALAVMLLARTTVNVNRLSMHDFYRWRLADAFAVTREAAEETNPAKRRQKFAAAAATRLSGLENDKPRLIICGTANINAVREVPTGQGGFCVAFDPEHVTLHGLGPVAQARTSDYEALVGDRRSTLFDVSAISGAAISPLMGAATRHAYRILFTATNVRLGVWLPHPNVVQGARDWIDAKPDAKPSETDSWWVRRPLLLLAWYLTPQLFRVRDTDKDAEREARLWAHVLKLRGAGKRSGAVWYRVMQPTLGLLWAEAAGRLSYRATWMYVTDGGHYDNLGLVEALRRGARHIVVLDASGDKADTWSTLGGAIELARADAGVEIDLDPTTMIKGGTQLAAGQVVRPWAYGKFSRPVAVPGLPQQGEIWICKLGWWTDAPWDVLAYARNHSTYPCDSTLQQLYDANEFSAYQELGAAAVLDAAGYGPRRTRPSPLPLAWPATTAADDTSRLAQAVVPAGTSYELRTTP
jgi:hypothetical protein